ncbi:antitoxin [Amycolatopsis echigonensis]|uniref:Antitoxin n=1 Tax=Amycolatopsis echigonensis TaxID=2576905 RepID=A0A2N3WFJ2_9PSEU|nr:MULTISPECIES: antitoxin [Amycolatopsis]MBB2499529.1 antitoxin [Amycolatopsis echigonensis]PKV92656.1 antitoxin protein of toxin-antitoxin system [Amycolatopsis niigatensis]
MGINFDELKNKATEALRENSGKLEQGLEKAAEFAKSKVSGHDSQIDGGVGKAKDLLGKVTGKHDEGGEKPEDGKPEGGQPGGQQ